MGVLPIGQIWIKVSKPKGFRYPLLPKTIGDHIRRRRIDLKLIQLELGQHIGVHGLSITNWELNRTTPELKHIPAIIAFLGCNPLPCPTTLAERLVLHRRGRGWSQKRLADELDVDPTTLARWERGEKTPWGSYAVKVDALVGGIGRNSSPLVC